MDNRWVLPLHCDGRERGGEEEGRFPRRHRSNLAGPRRRWRTLASSPILFYPSISSRWISSSGHYGLYYLLLLIIIFIFSILCFSCRHTYNYLYISYSNCRLLPVDTLFAFKSPLKARSTYINMWTIIYHIVTRIL